MFGLAYLDPDVSLGSIEMILNILAIAILPMLIPGIINRVKAILVGRKGQSLFQPYYHFWKLLNKSEVISDTASWLTIFAPLMALIAVFCAALFVPMFSGKTILSFKYDFVVFVYLLSLAKGIMVLAAMDSGSSFEGMGASREISFTAFLEPAFMLIMGSLLFGGQTNTMAELVNGHIVNTGNSWNALVAVLTIVALYIMLLVESARVPFDDPSTHLELTMIHEVMILDYSGFSLALIHYTASLKLLLYASLISHLIIPAGFWATPLLFIVLLFLISIVTGIVESMMARFRMNRNLELVIVPVSISLLVFSALIVRYWGVGV